MNKFSAYATREAEAYDQRSTFYDPLDPEPWGQISQDLLSLADMWYQIAEIFRSE